MRAARRTIVLWRTFALGTLMLGTGCPSEEGPPSKEPAAKAVAPVAKAHLGHLSGEVKVKRAAGDDWSSAVERMSLFENDKVRTAGGASAALEFVNGSTVNLGEDALIAIAETHPRPGQDRTDLTVLKGRVDAELDDPDKKSLSVATPAATVRAGREIVFQ